MPKTHDGLSDAQLAQMIGQVVEKHVRPLRKELAAYKEHNDLQKILGGIGYILGLFGVAFYIAARRNHKTSSRTP
jgi:nickel transport protein